MEKPTFVNLDGSMTGDGEKLISWIESQFLEADQANDIAAINGLSGDIKHYYVNVYKLNRMTGGSGSGLTPQKWLSDYRNSIAMNAWRNFQFVQEQVVKQSQLEQTTARTEELATGLNQLKEALAEQMAKMQAENAALHAELDKLRGGGKAKRGGKTEDADETPEPEA